MRPFYHIREKEKLQGQKTSIISMGWGWGKGFKGTQGYFYGDRNLCAGGYTALFTCQGLSNYIP